MLHRLRFELLDHLVFPGRHAGIGEQEVEDAVFRSFRIPGQFLRGVFIPELAGFGPAARARGHLAHPMDLPPRANQRVAAHQLLAEPGNKGAAVLRREDAVEPQAHLRQLHRHRVEVHAEHVPVCQAHLHLLQLRGELVVRNAPAGFLLLALHIGLGQLVHHLVEERRRPHGRFAHLQPENVVCCFAR